MQRRNEKAAKRRMRGEFPEMNIEGMSIAAQNPGEDVRTQKEVMACQDVSSIVKTSLGPVGLDKMLVDDIGDVTITTDGATILRMLGIPFPPAKYNLIMSIAAQNPEDNSGEDVRTQNDVSRIVKTSLGPVGLDKMLVDDIGDVTFTNDGATILRMLGIPFPPAKNKQQRRRRRACKKRKLKSRRRFT